jgi:hypothetical protein
MSGADKEKVVWNDERDLVLIDALVHMRNHRPSDDKNGFIKRSDWEHIASLLKSKFGGEYPNTSIRSRYNNVL